MRNDSKYSYHLPRGRAIDLPFQTKSMPPSQPYESWRVRFNSKGQISQFIGNTSVDRQAFPRELLHGGTEEEKGGKRVTVAYSSNGSMTCRECDPIALAWCKHIEAEIKNGRDAQYLFQLGPTRPDDEPLRFETPLFPVDGIWVLVELSCVLDRDGNFTGSYLVSFDSTVTADFRVNTSMKIGILSPGEGRFILRQMILDWFYPEIYEPRSCTSLLHGAKATADLAQLLASDDKRSVMLNAWMLVLTRMCLICNRENATPALGERTWPDDLIPDAEDKSPFSLPTRTSGRGRNRR